MNTGKHLSAVHFHFLQSFTNNLMQVQISEVGVTLAPLLLGPKMRHGNGPSKHMKLLLS